MGTLLHRMGSSVCRTFTDNSAGVFASTLTLCYKNVYLDEPSLSASNKQTQRGESSLPSNR